MLFGIGQNKYRKQVYPTQETYSKTEVDALVTQILSEVPHIVETWEQGTEGYRVWSDGSCEQWGRVTTTPNRGSVAFLHIPFENTNYVISALESDQKEMETVSTDTAGYGENIGVSGLTPISFDYSITANRSFSWFAKGKRHPVSVLPEEYQKVSFIKGNGTQYIDLGIDVSGTLVTRLICRNTSGEAQDIFGARVSTSSGMYAISLNATQFVRSYNTTNTNLLATDRNWHTINLIRGIAVIDQTFVVATANNTFTSANPLHLFTINTNGTPTTPYASMEVAGLMIYDNTTLIGEFVPCYRKSDETKHTAGLYDLITETFYQNMGSGYFEVGEDIE